MIGGVLKTDLALIYIGVCKIGTLYFAPTDLSLRTKRSNDVAIKCTCGLNNEVIK